MSNPLSPHSAPGKPARWLFMAVLSLSLIASASPPLHRLPEPAVPKPSPTPGPTRSYQEAARVPILEYHSTEFNMSTSVQMKTSWFLAQLAWLDRNGFQTLDGDALIRFVRGEGRPAGKSFVLRFDLGLPQAPDYREVILPALKRHGFHALFFILPSAMSDRCGGDPFCWSELRAWERAGWIEVASHGMHHPDYQELIRADQIWDAREGKRLLEAKLHHPIRFFAFPYDSVPEDPEGLLKPLGFELGFAGYRQERSVVFSDKDPYALPAIYPYSGEKTYPIINGSGGKTFGELMLSAVSLPE